MKLRHVIVFFLLALFSRESVATTDSISVTVDTLCDGWNVCVTDETFNGRINSIYLSKNNVKFDTSDLDYIEYGNLSKSVCFKVKIVEMNLPATAALLITLSDSIKKELLFKSNPSLSVVPLDKFGIVFFDTDINTYYDTTVTIRNLSHTKPMVIKSVSVIGSDSSFIITSLSNQLPITVGYDVPFSFSVRLYQSTIGILRDSIKIETDCFDKYFNIYGVTETGIIEASDLDFGELYVGEEVCDAAKVSNTGESEYTLIRLDTSTRSSMNIYYSRGDNLPRSMELLTRYSFFFCYKPEKESLRDSLLVIWKTNIDSLPLQQMKSFSIITGKAVSPKVLWEDKSLTFFEDSTQIVFKTTIFHNHSPAGTFVKRFYISGKDSAEFSIFNSLSPLSNVTMLRNETDWFDIAFKPDMTKPLPERYADRHATLVAELADSNVTMELIGTFNPLHVKHELALEDFSFSPNPIYGQDATLSFTLPEPKQLAISIYDILGREVITIPTQHYSVGSQSYPIATSKLGDGSYILRVSDGVLTESISFRVVK